VSSATSRVRAWPTLVLAIVWLVAPRVALALSLSLTPPSVDVVIPAGASAQVQVDVANGGDGALELRAYLYDWWHDETGTRFHPPGTVQRSAALWSSVLPTRLQVAARSQDRFTLNLEPPDDAVGGYYAVLWVEAASVLDPASGSPSLGVGGRIGVMISVRIQGTGTEALVVDGVDIQPPTDSTPLAVSAQVRNTGDVHLFPEARVVILDGEDQVSGRLDGERAFAFPGQDTTLEARWGGELEPGSYTALITVLYGEGQAATFERAFAVEGAPP